MRGPPPCRRWARGTCGRRGSQLASPLLPRTPEHLRTAGQAVPAGPKASPPLTPRKQLHHLPSPRDRDARSQHRPIAASLLLLDSQHSSCLSVSTETTPAGEPLTQRWPDGCPPPTRTASVSPEAGTPTSCTTAFPCPRSVLPEQGCKESRNSANLPSPGGPSL